MLDPLVQLAQQRIVKASADLEVQLSQLTGGGPAIEILKLLREKAAESLACLVIVDAEDPKAIRTLQNEVKRYDEWIAWLRQIISEGRAIDAQTTVDEREELLDLLTQTPEGIQEAIDLGLVDDIPRDG